MTTYHIFGFRSFDGDFTSSRSSLTFVDLALERVAVEILGELFTGSRSDEIVAQNTGLIDAALDVMAVNCKRRSDVDEFNLRQVGQYA